MDRENPNHLIDNAKDSDPAPAQQQEKVEDRGNVSTVTPEDYPLQERRETEELSIAGEENDDES